MTWWKRLLFRPESVHAVRRPYEKPRMVSHVCPRQLFQAMIDSAASRLYHEFRELGVDPLPKGGCMCQTCAFAKLILDEFSQRVTLLNGNAVIQ